ncbi:molybdopterin molybdotransferase MoeA [Martelella alba]|uniref:Molybdopterin molybdenumtransferase n=1 Tax=Martelella alba TaxID=2590451 RepID=A0A506UIE9_9HYPH|nr:gephyrin-like molybdotransferase Glp [Martelella alba]TPW33089.1 molybdopterin molybdotransferase MoeA [Martelella alba]
MKAPLLPVEDALQRLLAMASPVSVHESVSLGEADGRVLAHGLSARLTHPPFAASAMDGYAVAAPQGVSASSVFSVIGETAAGDPPASDLRSGEAMRIFTGAPMPANADTVVIQEDTERLEDGTIIVTEGVAGGANVRSAGLDFSVGQPILGAGRKLDFRAISLAAAAGHDRLDVYRKPKLAILATGNELVPPGTTPGTGQIVASSGTGISALMRASGAEVFDCGIAGDSETATRAAIAAALEKAPDVLVTIGGASVGDHDLVRPVLQSMGMTLDFWRIAMRPGKPLMVGKLDGTIIVGLPGNPVSSFVCALVFLEPLMRMMAGLPPAKRLLRARLSGKLPPNGPRQAYLRARIVQNATGVVVAEPLLQQDSSLLSVLALADALLIRATHAPEAKDGDPVDVLMLDS